MMKAGEGATTKRRGCVLQILYFDFHRPAASTLANKAICMINLNELLQLNAPVVLASASPRRRQLLEQIRMRFSVCPADLDESEVSDSLPPERYVRTLATRKARQVAADSKSPAIVIGADTIVVLEQQILNKPRDAREARTMLRRLSACRHNVYTGIAIVDSRNLRHSVDVQRTQVEFRHLFDAEIEAYVATGAPLDKAGAYGIQDDFGAVFVREIRGCYYNVVGLPLELLYRRLQEFCTVVE